MTKSAIRNMIALSKVLRKAAGLKEEEKVQLSTASKLRRNKQIKAESKRLDAIEEKVNQIKEKMGLINPNIEKYSSEC